MKRILVGNHKMNLLTLAERDNYLSSLLLEAKKISRSALEIVVCPACVHLEKFAKELSAAGMGAGVQNIYAESRGSFTGEISAPMVSSLGATHVIVGHSERRNLFGETNAQSNAKIRAAISAGLNAIYCVGESAKERKEGSLSAVIESQLAEGLEGVAVSQLDKVIVAYEPIWAVGSDQIPSTDEIMEARILLRKILSRIYGLEKVNGVRILYGGSVKAATAKQLCVEAGMDGVLVGRESLIPGEFLKIGEIINKAYDI